MRAVCWQGVNKLTTETGAQQHGQRYIPMLLDRIAEGELSTSHLVTHELSLEDGAKGRRAHLRLHRTGRPAQTFS